MNHEMQLCIILLWGVVIGYLLGRYEKKLEGIIVEALDNLREKIEGGDGSE